MFLSQKHLIPMQNPPYYDDFSTNFHTSRFFRLVSGANTPEIGGFPLPILKGKWAFLKSLKNGQKGPQGAGKPKVTPKTLREYLGNHSPTFEKQSNSAHFDNIVLDSELQQNSPCNTGAILLDFKIPVLVLQKGSLEHRSGVRLEGLQSQLLCGRGFRTINHSVVKK